VLKLETGDECPRGASDVIKNVKGVDGRLDPNTF